jgi:hypothetical protein
MSPRRVVTLPSDVSSTEAIAFAEEAQKRGADLLELRTDLHENIPVERLASLLPLVVSERGRPLPGRWIAHALLVDKDISERAGDASLPSHHASTPLSPEQALSLWRRSGISDEALVKHVEPLGPPSGAARLFKTQELLAQAFGAHRITVLGMGPCALPFRCALAPKNALDYVALRPSFRAAQGQRLLEDAVRERTARPGRRRLGILGSSIDGSRSPRIHLQPFDRIDLPADAPIAELLTALHPVYAGFAVTSPFKKVAALAVGADIDAVNTLVRQERGTWAWANTDVAGAEAVLTRLDGAVTALGDGGVTTALRMAARTMGKSLQVLRRADVGSTPLHGSYVWTWPKDVIPPPSLRFSEADVAVVAYGAAARQIAGEIRQRGGRPKMLGAKWFIAQARRQRELWENA